jgi:beta-mannosidase
LPLPFTSNELKDKVVVTSINIGDTVICRTFLFGVKPKDLELQHANIRFRVEKGYIEVVSDHLAYGVFIDVPDGVALSDNYFHLLPDEKKVVTFQSSISIEQLKRSIKIKSLVDTY